MSLDELIGTDDCTSGDEGEATLYVHDLELDQVELVLPLGPAFRPTPHWLATWPHRSIHWQPYSPDR